MGGMKKGRKGSASPMAIKIKEKFKMSVKKWAEKYGFKYQTVCHVLAGTQGKVYGMAGIGQTGRIVAQLKKCRVWIIPESWNK